MKATTTDNGQWKNTVLIFKDNKHTMPAVLAAARCGPTIDVALKDIQFDFNGQNKAVKFQPFVTDIDELDLIVYKHEGKFIVLTGGNHYTRATAAKQSQVKAQLLTSVALKNARVVAPQAEEPARAFAAPAPSYGRPRTPYSERRYGNDR